jgi:hypothetical protein
MEGKPPSKDMLVWVSNKAVKDFQQNEQLENPFA